MKQDAAPAACNDGHCCEETVSLLEPRELLSAGARDWWLSPRTTLLIIAAPLVVVLAGAGSALFGKEAYKWFTGEDRFAETLQACFYVSALILGLLVVRQLVSTGRNFIALLYAIVCCGLVFMVGEELSWGQRVFGWSTPETFQEINKQEETNLHNVYGVGATFKWLQLAIGAYGTVLPLLLYGSRKLEPYRAALSWVVPHYTLVPCFAMLFAWRMYRNLLEPPDGFYFVVSEYNEVLELTLALGMFLFMLYQLRRLKRSAVPSRNTVIPTTATAH